MSKGGVLSNKGDIINIIKLDDIVINNDKRKVKGIKIDTEGEDYKVLIGAKKIIQSFHPEIIIEVRESNKIDIQNFLKPFGYNLYDVFDLKKKISLNSTKIKTTENIFATTKPSNL